MAMAKNVLSTAPQQDAIRRAAKLKKQAQRRSNGDTAQMATGGNTLFDTIRRDRQEIAEERSAAIAAQAEREMEFRIDQSHAALEFLPAELDGLARRMAILVIQAFPDATPTEGLSRTSVAIRTATSWLTPEESKRSKAIALGVSFARASLSVAYRAVSSNR